MATRIISTSGVSVSTPDTFTVATAAESGEQVGARKRRSGGATAENREADAIAGSIFAEDGVPERQTRLVERLTITPKPGAERAPTRRRPGGEEFTVNVDVAAGENAIILVEQGGLYRWVMPDATQAAAPAGRRRRSGGAGRLTFDLMPTTVRTESKPGRRSLVSTAWSYLRSKLEVYVYKWIVQEVAEAAGAAAAEFLFDRHNTTGLQVMTGVEPADWTTQPFTSGGTTAKRILLFIHGTFSSTKGSFGGLREGPRRMITDRLFAGYDSVIGFEHKTLLETPLQNATQLIQYLADAAIAAGSTLDIVCFSRGGLVARSFVEQLAAERLAALPGLRVNRVVFVGCTNAGTYLAEPDNVQALVDTYTTMFAWGMGVLGKFYPPSAPAAAILEKAATGIGDFVKALAEGAIEGNAVPGLAAMQPDGAFIRQLNSAPEPAGPTPEYFGTGVDFEPPPLLEGHAALTALDAVVDRLFQNMANDAVVHTDSMGTFGTRQHWLLQFNRRVSDSVFHIRYFNDDAVATTLAGWLTQGANPVPMAMVAPPEDDPATFHNLAIADAVPEPVLVPTPRSAPGSTGRGMAGRMKGKTAFETERKLQSARREGFGSLAKGTVRSGRENKATAPALEMAAAPTLSPSTGGQRINCQARTSMPAAPPVKTTFDITVALSREQLKAAAGMATAATSLDLSADDELTITVAAVENGAILSPPRVTGVTPPGPREIRIFSFEASAPKRGRTSFLVEIWRAQQSLFSASLTGEAGGTAKGEQAVAAAVRPTDDGMVTLTVVDRKEPGGDNELAFTLTGLGLNREGSRTPDSRTYDAYIDEILTDLENAFSGASASLTMAAQLRALGLQLADDLLPREIREDLWRERDNIKGILLVTDEHRLPWEVMVIDDPRDPAATGFHLAEKGLTRWFRRAGFPRRRTGRLLTPAAYVKPDYLNPGMDLPGLEGEIAALDATLGPLERWKATSDAVVQSLATGAKVGVLHLCGHGDAGSNVLRSGLLLLQDQKDPRGGDYLNDLLDSRVVAANVRFHPDTSPIVFLNVCRAGRVARGLVGASGYAKAFVAPRSGNGAGVFVAAQWEVADDAAAAFSQAFYGALATGAELSAAATAARAAAKALSPDLTWLAYSVYGDPATRFGQEVATA